MKTKKWLLLALCLLLALALVPATARAEATSGKCGDNLSWSFNTSTGKLTITGSGDMDNYLYDPPWASFREAIKSVSLPNGLTRIGDCAFFCCDGITSITIPDSITSIGYFAFRECSGLTSLTISKGVNSISDLAFGRCNSLTSFQVAQENKYYTSIDGVLFSNDMKTLIAYPAGKQQTGYVIPNGVTTIGCCAFDSSNLTSITIPISVTRVEAEAFCKCSVTDIFYLGSDAQADGIQVLAQDTNDPYFYAYWHYLSQKQPTITVQPEDKVGEEGSIAWFHVWATGKSGYQWNWGDIIETGLNYQWQWSADKGKTWNNSSSATTVNNSYNKAELYVNAVAARNGYQYRCQVTNCVGTATSTAATLTVISTYTVTLNPNGGSVSPTTKTVTYGQAYGTLPTPTRSGYTFNGWWTTKETGGKQVTATTVCYASGNYTLYARWKAGQTYTVTLNPNGGTCGTSTKTVTYGTAYGTMPVPKRLGYTFAGWWTVKDAGGKKVTASTICYATGNYTLYARWTEGYTMTFDPNGGAVSPTTKVVKYGQQYGAMPTPTRAGYTFTGWWTTKAEGGKKVVSTTVCYAASGYTLYARWTAKKFVVTLNPNGGECATATKTVTYGQAYGTMPVPSPRTGYTFAGWYTAKTGGKKVTATTICYATGNYTLYARWTPKTYTVTLNPNGGTCTAGSKTVTYGQEYGTLPVPTRDGYVFAGWWTKKDSGGTQVFSSTTCYATGSYTLYARWKKN